MITVTLGAGGEEWLLFESLCVVLIYHPRGF